MTSTVQYKSNTSKSALGWTTITIPSHWKTYLMPFAEWRRGNGGKRRMRKVSVLSACRNLSTPYKRVWNDCSISRWKRLFQQAEMICANSEYRGEKRKKRKNGKKPLLLENPFSMRPRVTVTGAVRPSVENRCYETNKTQGLPSWGQSAS